MLQALALVLGATFGFLGSRMLRRPSRTATAASVARNVGGALGRRRGLSLPELQRAVFSEMMRHVRDGRGGQVMVPTRYVVRLNPADASAVEEAPRFFTDGLAQALRAASAQHGWVLDGAVSIEVKGDDSRHPGAPGVLAVPPEGPRSAEPAPPPSAPAIAPAGPSAPPPPLLPADGSRRLMLHRLDRDERIALGAEPVTIGRAEGMSVVVDDKRVSRRHAVVRPRGPDWVVVDEGSSNGTRVNGSALIAGREVTLRPGDSIEVGPLRLRFDIDDRPSAKTSSADRPIDAGATGALDDATRRRISAEYLGPDRP